MNYLYEPASDFLKSILAEEVPLTGSLFAEANMRLLLTMVHDPDRSNRDWAALIIAQQEIDTPELRRALLTGAVDEDEYVRGEAITGLAQRDRMLALPFIRRELTANTVCLAIFEAAEIVGDQSLIEGLEWFNEPSDDPHLDRAVADALAACRTGTPST